MLLVVNICVSNIMCDCFYDEFKIISQFYVSFILSNNRVFEKRLLFERFCMFYYCVELAEWFKAFDLSSNVCYTSQVRILHSTTFFI
jgi:hypothetical protein